MGLNLASMITGIVGYLGNVLKKDNSVLGFISEFTEETIKWIKPLFLKEDESLQREVQKLKENPDSEVKQNAVKTLLESELEDNPEVEKYLKEIYEKISKKEDFNKSVHNEINITGNNNQAFQNITGSKINTGSGDIVEGNKTENNKTYNIDNIDNAQFD